MQTSRSEIKIAYIISAYKLPEQLVRLVQRLNDPFATFFIHVDKRTNQRVYEQMAAPLSHFQNVQFLKRHNCHWGDFGHVRASLKGIQALVENSIEYDYVFLLTGQDYPICPVAEIKAFLQKNQGQEFIQYTPLPIPHWSDCNGGLDRIAYWNCRVHGKLLRFPQPLTSLYGSLRNKPLLRLFSLLLWSPIGRFFPKQRCFPNGLVPFGGSSYWCLSRECIHYLNGFVARNPGYVRFFHFVDVPDEIFFQTILMNSPLQERVVNDDLHYIRWPGPAILNHSDFEAMRQSGKLFARKFDTTQDGEVLNLLDGELGPAVAV